MQRYSHLSGPPCPVTVWCLVRAPHLCFLSDFTNQRSIQPWAASILMNSLTNDLRSHELGRWATSLTNDLRSHELGRWVTYLTDDLRSHELGQYSRTHPGRPL